MKFWSKVFYPLSWFGKKVAELYYDLKVWIYSKCFKKNKIKTYGKNTVKIRDAVFYALVMLIPLAMFVLVNVFINGNAILMAFQDYDYQNQTFFFIKDGGILKHFKYWVHMIFVDKAFSERMVRSLYVYLISTVLTTFVPILFSYYVYKKMLGYKLFKIILFLPSILSSIITVTIYKVFVNEVIPLVYEMVTGTVMKYGLLRNIQTAFSAVLFYNIWMGMGGGLLTQLAAMNTVEPSVAESAQLDGVGFWGEFWHIVLPACYEVLTLGFVTGIAGIFTNSLNLYAFYDTGAFSTTETVGYYITVETLKGDKGLYTQLSAWGVMITLVVTPLTLGLRHLINRYGPSEDTYEKRKKA